jgi:hypothetical protein
MFVWDKKAWAVVVLISLVFSAVGFYDLVVPLQRKNIFLREKLVVVRRVRRSRPVSSVVVDEEKDIMRWSVSQGRLLSWKSVTKKGRREFAFSWLGEYAQMLFLLKAWPDFLRIKDMHWSRGKKGRVYWHGHYKERA